MDHAGRDTVVAVASDHGMGGMGWKFHPNVPLRQAGLLAMHPDGKLDLSKTRVIYAPNDGGYLLVNRVGRKGGIVPADQVEAVLAKAQSALAAVKAHDGAPLVTQFLRPDAETIQLGIGGPRGGDMYLDLRPGYYFDSDWNKQEMFKVLAPGSAGHVFDPRRPDMHAIQAYWGPGVKRGAALGAVRNIDLAPTLSRLLALPAPAQSTGRVLTEILE
jgi:predicted AlkP superfamily phosphohydrolase/phosphomutase